MAEGQKKGLIRIILLSMLCGVTVVLLLAPAYKVDNAIQNERQYILGITGTLSERQQWARAVSMASAIVEMCAGEDGAGADGRPLLRCR